MNTPDVRPPSLPPAPWILIDRTTVEQTADLLELLAEWLAGADPVITEDCAQACSARGQRHARGGRLGRHPRCPYPRSHRGGELVVVTAPAAPPLPEELTAVLRRMRLPYLRTAAPRCWPPPDPQRWDPRRGAAGAAH